MGGDAHVPWNKQKWNKTKGLVKQIENDYTMSNPKIQDKIIEILEEKTDTDA